MYSTRAVLFGGGGAEDEVPTAGPTTRVREQYTKAKEAMLTHIPEAPWWIVEAVDKKRARLNCITHLLHQIPYQTVHHEAVVLPPRVHNPEYHRGPIPKEMYVPVVY